MKIFNRELKIPLQAELPLLFMILYLPAYLGQGKGLPFAYFDLPAVHFQIIIISILYSLLILYLTDNIPLNEDSPPPGPGLDKSYALPSFREFALTLSALTIIYLSINVAVPVISKLNGNELSGNPIVLTKKIMLLPCLISCLFSAMQEELFFRGYGFYRLKESGFAPQTAMILISLFFAAGHFYEGFHAFVYALLAGLFLTWRIQKGASLFSLIPAHALLNFTIILLNFLSEGKEL
ncbi:MAG: hypothetical protein B6241_00690 [Spirochaetaceae bacterium 4572_59]|nr:MAG: hypothetical protein B6241_00690 [Spirochaetaceae bacterium 4572_59]